MFRHSSVEPSRENRVSQWFCHDSNCIASTPWCYSWCSVGPMPGEITLYFQKIVSCTYRPFLCSLVVSASMSDSKLDGYIVKDCEFRFLLFLWHGHAFWRTYWLKNILLLHLFEPFVSVCSTKPPTYHIMLLIVETVVFELCLFNLWWTLKMSKN